MKCPHCKHELSTADLKRLCKSVDAKLLGSLGGIARAENLSANRRHAIAKKAAAKRWGDRPRCPCGAMTAKRAKARGHKCEGKERG
jgi:hypothetical protein